MMNVSKFVGGLTTEFVVVEFSDQKDARKSTRHNDEPVVDVDVERLTDRGTNGRKSAAGKSGEQGTGSQRYLISNMKHGGNETLGLLE